jgi:hypothetical protein
MTTSRAKDPTTGRFIRDYGQDGRRAPSTGERFDFGEPEEFLDALYNLFGGNYMHGPGNTEFMVELLSRDDYRGRTARMYAKDKVFKLWLRDFIARETADVPMNTTRYTVLMHFYRNVNWRTVATKLAQK